MTDVINSVIRKKDQEEDRSPKVESNLSPETVSVKEDLTIVKGIGASVAEKLFQAGIRSVHDLAQASREQLMGIKGIGSETAVKFINAAKLYTNTPTLKSFTGSNPTARSSEPKVEKQVLKEPWFDDKFKRPKSGVWYSPQGKEAPVGKSSAPIPPLTINEDEISSELEDLSDAEELSDSTPMAEDIITEKDNHPRSNVIESQHSSPLIIADVPATMADDIVKPKSMAEKMTSKELTEIIAKVQGDFSSSEYYLIKSNPFLKNIFRGFDLLGVKIIQVNETLDLLLLVPVKINIVKGLLLVSENEVKYNFSNRTQYNHTITTLTKAMLDNINHSQEAIFDELVSEGALFQFFQKYLKLSFSIEKTITSKRLFFRAGALQYKILIEPILINQGEVGFIEKTIPFAYHKPFNLHIVEHNTFLALLSYLEQKYYLLETHQDHKTSLSRYFDITTSLMEELRLYSIPFIGFGIIFAFTLLSQVPVLIQVFMNVGFGLIIIYGLVVGYLYYQFYNKKKALQQEFRVPYYQQPHELDETSLILINEQLSPKMMSQFSYECLGKDIPFPLLTQLEQDQVEKTLTEPPEKLEKEEYFESPAPSLQDDSQKKDKLTKKFSTFLED